LLVAATRNDAPVVCANAIESLARVAPDAGQPQIRAALDHETPLVRFAGCMAVGDLRDRSCASSIRKCRGDSDARVRLAAAYAAYRCGDKNAGAELAAALRDNPDEKIRADAAWLIGRLGDRAAMVRLKNAAGRELSPYVVTYIHGAMAALGDNEMVDRIIQYVLKSDNITRLVSLQTLYDVPDQRAARALQYRLNDKSDFLQTRLLAARALARIGSRAGYDLALASLAESRPDAAETRSIRCNAALTLGEIRDRGALSALGNLAQTDRDEQTQVAACCAITQIVRGTARR
jgi:HEAT repeat protein